MEEFFVCVLIEDCTFGIRGGENLQIKKSILVFLAGVDGDLLEMNDAGDMGTVVIVLGGIGGVLSFAGKGIVAGHGRTTTGSETQVGFWGDKETRTQRMAVCLSDTQVGFREEKKRRE